MKHTTLGLTMATIFAGALIGCGGSTAPAATATATVAAPKAATAAATTPAATATPTPTAAAAVAAASTIAVTAVEDGEKYSYDNNKLTAKAGEVTIKLTNKAGNVRPHTFSVQDAAGKDLLRSERVQPGASMDFKVNLPEAGTYKIYCNLTGHADKGQTGTLTVVKG